MAKHKAFLDFNIGIVHWVCATQMSESRSVEALLRTEKSIYWQGIMSSQHFPNEYTWNVLESSQISGKFSFDFSSYCQLKGYKLILKD